MHHNILYGPRVRQSVECQDSKPPCFLNFQMNITSREVKFETQRQGRTYSVIAVEFKTDLGGMFSAPSANERHSVAQTIRLCVHF